MDSVFFHPDFTVGPGVAPDLPSWLADFTADWEFHPTLKNESLTAVFIVTRKIVNQFQELSKHRYNRISAFCCCGTAAKICGQTLLFHKHRLDDIEDTITPLFMTKELQHLGRRPYGR